MTQHIRLSKKSFVTSLLFIVGVAIGFSLLYYLSTSFRIKHVTLIGVSTNDKNGIIPLIRNKNIFSLNEKDVGTDIHSHFPYLTVTSIDKKWPDTVTVYMRSEKPFAYIQTDAGYLTISLYGMVLKKERSDTIPEPHIVFYQPIRHTDYQVGQSVTYTQIQKSLLFIQALYDEGFPVETVAIDSVDMIACNTSGFTVAFSQKRPTDLQKYELRQLVKQLKIGALRVKRLDLRFDKPVVELQSQ